jgi:hypothetical protein
MFGMKKQELSERKYLKLVDAGIAFNLPYPPVSGERSERKSDILIFCDMSATGKGVALMKCEKYAREKGLPFPVIEYEDIEKRSISIFKDDTNKEVPVVIYMPRVSDQVLWEENKINTAVSEYTGIEDFDIEACVKKGFCNTINFKYSREQSQQVMHQMEFNVLMNKEKIIDVIRSVVEQEQ